MALEKISGEIKTVQGKTYNKHGDWEFSILEIGDKVLQGVRVGSKFNVFLTPGNQISIWLNGPSSLVALERYDGKLFCVISKNQELSH